jgi:hypothetical protein
LFLVPSALHEALLAAFPPPRRALLDRVVLRARADAAHALDIIGTGAPSTAKRAAAVQMALDGEEIPAIAAAVHLSEARVTQVLENVLASGLPALYPTFVEDVPLPDGMTGPALWKILRPIVESSPSSHTVRTSKWNPAFLLELLITQGTLEDGSNSRIETIIRSYIDPEKTQDSMTFEYTDSSHAVPGTNTSIWWTVLVLAIGLLLLTFSFNGGGFFTGFFGLITTFASGATLIKQFLELRLLRRVLAHNAKHAAGPASTQPTPQLRPVTHDPFTHGPVPAAPITILHAADLPSVPWNLDLLSDTANALGKPPLKILYLWVFAAQADQGGYETEGWPQLGPVHLLLNATALRIGQLMGNLDKLLVADQSTLDATISAYEDRVGTYKRPMLFVTGALGKYLYRGFPIHTLVCSDSVWKPAVHQLAARCDLAVVNLSGFNPSHPGLEYEILHLLSGGPPRQFVFLYERYTDADAVITGVLELWSRLESPPATVPELIFIRVPDSQNTGYAAQFLPPGKKPGWIVRSMMDREGEYLPVAPRILAYVDRRAAARAQVAAEAAAV